MFDCSSVKVKIDKQLTDQGFTGILLSLNSDGVKTFFLRQTFTKHMCQDMR